MAPQRRDVLRAGGGLAALLTGLAGCTEQIDDVTGGGGPDTPSYAGALLDPGALFEMETRGFVSVDAEAYREQQAALPEEFRRSVDDTAGDVEGVDTADADRLSGVFGRDRGDPENRHDDATVSVGRVTGSFDAEAAASQAESENETLTERGEYEGYTLYAGASEYDLTQSVAVAISSDALVGATVNVPTPKDVETSGDFGEPELSATPSGVPTAVDAVRAAIDTADGGGDPLTDDELAAQVLADLGDQPLVGGALVAGATVRRQYFGDGEGGTRDPENEVATDVKALTQGLTAVAGSGGAPETTAGEVVVRLYYESEDVVSDRAETLRSALKTAKSRSEDVTPPETEVTTDGRAVVLTITGDPQQLSEEFGAGEASGGSSARGTAVEPPQVTFGFEYDAQNRLTVIHEGGDVVPTDLQVRFESGGESRLETWPAGDDGIAAGDSYTTDASVDSGSQVLLVWQGEGEAAVLGKSEAP
jgi:hypothetical protein